MRRIVLAASHEGSGDGSAPGTRSGPTRRARPRGAGRAGSPRRARRGTGVLESSPRRPRRSAVVERKRLLDVRLHRLDPEHRGFLERVRVDVEADDQVVLEEVPRQRCPSGSRGRAPACPGRRRRRAAGCVPARRRSRPRRDAPDGALRNGRRATSRGADGGLVAERLDRLPQAVLQRDLRLPAEDLLRTRDVRLPNLRVVDGERLEHDLARRAREPQDEPRRARAASSSGLPRFTGRCSPDSASRTIPRMRSST